MVNYLKQKKILFFITFCCVSISFTCPANQSHDNPFPIIESVGLQSLNLETPNNFNTSDLSGKQVSLSDYKGKWILLVFWATWCSVCHTELPSLESIHQEFKNRPLTVVGVSIDKNLGPIKKYVKRTQLTFPMLHDNLEKYLNFIRPEECPSPTLFLLILNWLD